MIERMMESYSPLTVKELKDVNLTSPSRIARQFASAATAGEVGLVLSEAAERTVGISGYNFFAVNPQSAISDATDSVVYWCGDSSFPYEEFLKVLPITQNEFLGPQELMQGTKVHCVHQLFDRSYIEKTFSYNELWRDLHIERQVAMVFGTPEKNLGFACFTRSKKERPFSEEDLAETASLRLAAEQALGTINKLNAPLRKANDILRTLSKTVPDPLILLDSAGKVLWTNEDAKLWLDIKQFYFGSNLSLHTTSWKMEIIKRIAQEVFKNPAFSPDPEVLESIGILPGRKELFWRFIEGEKNEKSKILFCVSEQCSSRGNVLTPAGLKKFGLSPREAEVAALAAQGYAMLNIATRLNITKNTVHTHLKRIYRKLGVFSRAELAHKLLR